MDLTLFWVAIGLIVVGFLINLLGGWLHERERAGVAAPKTIQELIMQALGSVFTALRDALNPNRTVGQKVESIGSVIAYIGFVALAAWVLVVVFGGQKSTTTSTPGASASPS